MAEESATQRFVERRSLITEDPESKQGTEKTDGLLEFEQMIKFVEGGKERQNCKGKKRKKRSGEEVQTLRGLASDIIENLSSILYSMDKSRLRKGTF